MQKRSDFLCEIIQLLTNTFGINTLLTNIYFVDMISFLINILLILYTTTPGQKKGKPKTVDNKNPSKK